jgi:hypothetical protein
VTVISKAGGAYICNHMLYRHLCIFLNFLHISCIFFCIQVAYMIYLRCIYCIFASYLLHISCIFKYACNCIFDLPKVHILHILCMFLHIGQNPDQADLTQSERCGRKSRQAELKQKARHITWSMAESFEYEYFTHGRRC